MQLEHIDRDFGDAVRTVRQARAMSQADLASQVEARGYAVSQATLGKIERGERRVTIGEAQAIANALQVELNDLVSGGANPMVAQAFGRVTTAGRDLSHAARAYALQMLELCLQADAADELTDSQRWWLDTELVGQAPAWVAASDAAIEAMTTCERESLPLDGAYTAKLLDTFEADQAALRGRPERSADGHASS